MYTCCPAMLFSHVAGRGCELSSSLLLQDSNQRNITHCVNDYFQKNSSKRYKPYYIVLYILV